MSVITCIKIYLNCVQALDYKMCHPKNNHALHGALKRKQTTCTIICITSIGYVGLSSTI